MDIDIDIGILTLTSVLTLILALLQHLDFDMDIRIDISIDMNIQIDIQISTLALTLTFRQVLRRKATEPSGIRKASGGFDDVYDKGTYVCAGTSYFLFFISFFVRLFIFSSIVTTSPPPPGPYPLNLTPPYYTPLQAPSTTPPPPPSAPFLGQFYTCKYSEYQAPIPEIQRRLTEHPVVNSSGRTPPLSPQKINNNNNK